jgi:thiol-disulfide isomerase/thioredoxin
MVALVAAACSSGDAEPAASTATPVVSSTGVAGTPAPTRPASRPVAGPKLEVTGISGWLNSEPLTIESLLKSNKVVLVDFWTYTCVNCIRTVPFLREWQAKYKDQGLVILGVHTPEFEFEKVRANVEKAVAEHGITWPIAQDNDYGTWRAFGNRYWPAKYLIGADGELRYTHFGEGEYVATEEAVRSALKDAGYKVDGIPLGTVADQKRDQRATTMTRELYGGYERNFGFGGQYAGQDEYYGGPDHDTLYTDTGDHAHNKFYLHGVWRNEKEAIVHARETAEPEDYLALKFAATSVNVVIDPQGPEPFDVILEMDGQPLAKAQAGADVKFDPQGRSLVTVTSSRLYALVRLPEFGIHVLKLLSTSKNFAVFAFTFGVYESGI